MITSVPQTVVAQDPGSSDALEYFYAIPWCKALLEQPGLKLFQCDRHEYERAVGYEPFLSSLFADPRNVGIQHFISAFVPPQTTESRSHSLMEHEGGCSACRDLYPQHIDFYDLGPILHDVSSKLYTGVLTLFFDRAFATLGAAYTDAGAKYLVAYNNVRPLKPLMREDASISASQGTRLPVVVRSRIDGVVSENQRQILMLASVEGPDGVVYGTGEGILVEQTAVVVPETSTECKQREDLSIRGG